MEEHAATTAPVGATAAPVGETACPARHRGRLRWVVLAVVALATAVVWALGGFRGDATTIDEAPGREFSLGPMTIVVREATARRDYDDNWQVTLLGTCHVTADDAPDLRMVGDDLYAIATTTRPRALAERQLVSWGPKAGYGLERDYVGPGLGPMDCRFQGSLPASFRPTDGVYASFSDLTFGDDSVVGGQPEHWYAAGDAHRLRLPVRVVTGP